MCLLPLCIAIILSLCLNMFFIIRGCGIFKGEEASCRTFPLLQWKYLRVCQEFAGIRHEEVAIIASPNYYQLFASVLMGRKLTDAELPRLILALCSFFYGRR